MFMFLHQFLNLCFVPNLAYNWTLRSSNLVSCFTIIGHMLCYMVCDLDLLFRSQRSNLGIFNLELDN